MASGMISAHHVGAHVSREELSALADLGAGPHPDAGQRAQPAVGLVALERDQPLQRPGDPGGPDDRAGTGRVDVHPQPLPRRDPADGLRGRLEGQPEVGAGTGRGLAMTPDQVAEAAERLGVAPSTLYRHIPGGRSSVNT